MRKNPVRRGFEIALIVVVALAAVDLYARFLAHDSNGDGTALNLSFKGVSLTDIVLTHVFAAVVLAACGLVAMFIGWVRGRLFCLENEVQTINDDTFTSLEDSSDNNQIDQGPTSR